MTALDDDPTLDESDERELAKRLFNAVWDLLESGDRSLDDNELMLNAAHASLYHWLQVGDSVNEVRGEWQLARVYSVLGRGEPALHHAQRSLDICLQHDIGDFDLAFAYEALSRAHVVAGDRDLALDYAEQARAAGAGIADEEDRDVFMGDVADLPTRF